MREQFSEERHSPPRRFRHKNAGGLFAINEVTEFRKQEPRASALLVQGLGREEETPSRVQFESIPPIDREEDGSSGFEAAEIGNGCSLTLNTSGSSLRPKQQAGWAEPHSGMPAENLNSGVSPTPAAPLASHRLRLQKNKGKTATDVRRAQSNFPVLYEHGKDCLTPLDLNLDAADRSSSYNHRNRNSLHLSSAQSEEFENEFSQEFGWLGTAMKNQ